MKLSKVITSEIYPFTLYVSIGQSDKVFKKFVKGFKKFVKGLPEEEFTWNLNQQSEDKGVTLSDDGLIILRLNFSPKDSTDYALLQHEIFHVVENIMESIGTKHGKKSSEAFAYLIQFVTFEIYNQMWNPKNKKK